MTVVERHGLSAGGVAHGLLKDFGLREGAVACSVGHDAHNVIVAGRTEADMRIALAAVRAHQGGVVVVRGGEVRGDGAAADRRPLVGPARAGSRGDDGRAEAGWAALGCTLPYMGFNLIPLSVIPEIRMTDKGLVTVPGMQILPLLEAA